MHQKNYNANDLCPFFILIKAYPSIRALVGRNVGLPCNISQNKEGNSIKLVLWYKNNILGLPIYSIDARHTHNISSARHFLAQSYRDRASFELNISTRTALLFLNQLQAQDDGHYICRVDYRWTRTTISNVRLEVIGMWHLLFYYLFISFLDTTFKDI